MIKIKLRLIIFVIIMLSLTAYTIHGGIMDNEEIAIRNAVDDFFDTIKNEIGEREVDIAIKESIKYQINEVNIIEGYWVDYLFDFITHEGFVTQFPFEEQQFMPNNS